MLISAEGWKDKKAGRRERAGRKKRRSRGIFRIEFPRWFPWFGATARKEERVGASFFFTLAIPLAATPSFPRLKFFSPFPSPNPPYFPFSASSILQLSPRLLPPLLNSPFFSLPSSLPFDLEETFIFSRSEIFRIFPSRLLEQWSGGDQKKRLSS